MHIMSMSLRRERVHSGSQCMKCYFPGVVSSEKLFILLFPVPLCKHGNFDPFHRFRVMLTGDSTQLSVPSSGSVMAATACGACVRHGITSVWGHTPTCWASLQPGRRAGVSTSRQSSAGPACCCMWKTYPATLVRPQSMRCTTVLYFTMLPRIR